MSDVPCYYCKSQPCGCYAKFEELVAPLGGKGEFTVSDEVMQGWGVDHQAGASVVEWCLGHNGVTTRREKSWTEAWEERVRQAKEQRITFQGAPIIWDAERPHLVYGASVQCAPGFDPAWAEDEGAGCSDGPRNIGFEWTVAVYASEYEGLNERGFRRLLSEKMQKAGDEIMSAWRAETNGGS